MAAEDFTGQDLKIISSQVENLENNILLEIIQQSTFSSKIFPWSNVK